MFEFNCIAKRFYAPGEYELAPLWENGRHLYDGNSNVHGINVKKYFGPDWFNTGVAGSQTKDVILRFESIRERNKNQQIETIIEQIGGNNWIIGDCSHEHYWRDMRIIINNYRSLPGVKRIGICSLPFVDPGMNIRDRFGDNIRSMKLNNIFQVANIGLADVCKKTGVQYIDIFAPLKMLWDKIGKQGWYDKVHYAGPGQLIVSQTILKVMKL